LEKFITFTSPASFCIEREKVLDETYCKAGKMDHDCFSPVLDFCHTNLMERIRGDLLEGAQSAKSIYYQRHKLNVYGMLRLIHQSPPFDTMSLLR
jgi:hypothetical protein